MCVYCKNFLKQLKKQLQNNPTQMVVYWYNTRHSTQITSFRRGEPIFARRPTQILPKTHLWLHFTRAAPIPRIARAYFEDSPPSRDGIGWAAFVSLFAGASFVCESATRHLGGSGREMNNSSNATAALSTLNAAAPFSACA